VGKVAKIAVGCLVVSFLGVIVAVVAFGGLIWWGKTKVEQYAKPALESAQRISDLESKANRENPFTRPADGVVAEERLLKFLDVRRRVYAVYDRNRGFFESQDHKKDADFSDLSRGISIIGDARMALAEALVDVGMSHDEYQFLVESIYASAWAAGIEDGTGGKTVSELTGQAMDEAQKQLGATGNAEAQKAADALGAQRDAAVAMSQHADVPKANVALFRKHQDEIRKYAMAGLELVGL
jgi:hypothetical protein